LKVLVTGGRYWSDFDHLSSTLDKIHSETPITTVIHGAAIGADTLAEVWAASRKITTEQYPADWSKYSTKAGPIRNQHMLDIGKPDLVVAFPGGRGTNDMMSRTKKAGIKLYVAGRD